MIRRLDHVAVAVADTPTALTYFRDHLGLRVAAVDEPPEVNVRLTYLDLGNAWLQLVEPLDPDHPLATWIEANGEGLHHICLGVDDVVDELQRIGAPGLPVPALGSGRGRPAGFPAGPRRFGVPIECTSFDRVVDLRELPGALEHDRSSTGMRTDASVGATNGDRLTPLEVSTSYWQAECRRDLDAVMTYYRPDATYEGPDGLHRGHGAIRRAYEDNMRTYPGLEVEIVREFPAGDSSAIEFDAVLIDAQGGRHRVRGVNVVRVDDGRFVSVRSYEDAPGPE